MRIKIKAPKYFPKTILNKGMGLVSKSSRVPCFFSSLKLRMLTAGIKNIKTQGANRKKEDKSAKPFSKILNSPLKSHKIRPFSNKKSAITTQPMGEAKNELISFLNMANMF